MACLKGIMMDRLTCYQRKDREKSPSAFWTASATIPDPPACMTKQRKHTRQTHPPKEFLRLAQLTYHHLVGPYHWETESRLLTSLGKNPSTNRMFLLVALFASFSTSTHCRQVKDPNFSDLQACTTKMITCTRVQFTSPFFLIFW